MTFSAASVARFRVAAVAAVHARFFPPLNTSDVLTSAGLLSVDLCSNVASCLLLAVGGLPARDVFGFLRKSRSFLGLPIFTFGI